MLSSLGTSEFEEYLLSYPPSPCSSSSEETYSDLADSYNNDREISRFSVFNCRIIIYILLCIVFVAFSVYILVYKLTQ
jgi:hypothetical protein